MTTSEMQAFAIAKMPEVIARKKNICLWLIWESTKQNEFSIPPDKRTNVELAKLLFLKAVARDISLHEQFWDSCKNDIEALKFWLECKFEDSTRFAHIHLADHFRMQMEKVAFDVLSELTFSKMPGDGKPGKFVYQDFPASVATWKKLKLRLNQKMFKRLSDDSYKWVADNMPLMLKRNVKKYND